MKKFILPFVLLTFTFSSYAQHVLTDDATYKQTVYRALAQKEKDLPKGNLFSILKQKNLTEAERDALTFLYAYMPTTDITDYAPDYYLRMVRSTFKVQQETTWGRTVPEKLFRHFVLPLRINNEALDENRPYFVRELLPRVKHLSAKEAILEVNHWCHEHVTYTSSDSRTSAPLATLKNALGRCGEESTFTVAALRAVGIPARQVYTPRWGHTDDNHAWVEAWADGRWYFLGACEPEAILNLGWFNLPASRGLLMHTNVFGDYKGPELVMRHTLNFTEINVTGNYAKTGTVSVKVVDAQGKPLPDVAVQFKIYNYAELYLAASRNTDTHGMTSFEAGLGDALLFATKDGYFGLQKVTFKKDKQTITLRLNKKVGQTYQEHFHIIPPVGSNYLPPVTPEQKALNERRSKQEDSIRTVYTNTFKTRKEANEIASKLGYDSTKVAPLIVMSRGNHAEIISFLEAAQKARRAGQAVALLQSLRTKDLHDTPKEILLDHLLNTNSTDPLVLCPRVWVEMITPYRRYLQKNIPSSLQKLWAKDPQALVSWVKQNIVIRKDLNETNIITSPEGVWRSRTATLMARDVFFVAVLRALDIPAWKDKVDGSVHYKLGGKSVLINFDPASNAPLYGKLSLQKSANNASEDPVYYTSFTLSRFNGNGFSLLTYPENESSKWSTLFKDGQNVQSGYYMLVAGNRLTDGSVEAVVSLFDVKEGASTKENIEVPAIHEDLKVLGNLDLEMRFHRVGSAKSETLRDYTGDNYYVVGVLEPNKEPTNHALKDLERVADKFETWGRPIILLFQSDADYRKFRTADFPKLPKQVIYGILDEPEKIPVKASLPVILLGNTRGEVLYKLEGYTIGLGSQLIKVIEKL